MSTDVSRRGFLYRSGASLASVALSALLGMVNHTAQWFRPRGRLSAAEVAAGYAGLLVA